MRMLTSAVPPTAVLAIPSVARPQADPTDRPELERLIFDGVMEADKDELKKSIATNDLYCRSLVFWPLCKAGLHRRLIYEREYLDHTELARDVLRIRVFSRKRGIRDATVDTSVVKRGDDKVRVTFCVNEGKPTKITALDVAVPRLRIIEIAGAERVYRTPQGMSVKRFFDQLTLHFSIGQAF